MNYEIGENMVGLAAMAVPVVGSIALFSFLGVMSWSEARRKEREAYYKAEALKKIAESSAEGAKSALELLHEQEKVAVRKQREGQKLGGLITAMVGVGVMIFLRALVRDEPVYLVGIIPLLIGVALLVYALVLAPKPSESTP